MGIHGLHPHSLATVHAMRERLIAHCLTTFPQGGVILDIGCGSGAGTAALARRLPEHFSVIGLDINREAIARARHSYGTLARLRFHEGDLEDILVEHPGLQPVGALCISVSMFIPDTGAFYARLRQAMAQGGMFVDAPFALNAGSAAGNAKFKQKTYAMCGCDMNMSSCAELQHHLNAAGFTHTSHVEHGFDLMRLSVLFRDYPAPYLLSNFIRNVLNPPPFLRGAPRSYVLRRAVLIFAFFLRNRQHFRAGELIAIK